MKFSNPFRSVRWMKFKNGLAKYLYERRRVQKKLRLILNDCQSADMSGGKSTVEYFSVHDDCIFEIARKLRSYGYAVRFDYKVRFCREETEMTISWD